MEVNTAVSNSYSLKYKFPHFNFMVQKAEAQLAYELQAAKIQQRIRQEEIQIQVMGCEKLEVARSENDKNTEFW